MDAHPNICGFCGSTPSSLRFLRRILRGISRHTEQREVHAAVGAVLYESRHIREVVVLAVLEDQQTAGAQHALLEDELRDGRQRGRA